MSEHKHALAAGQQVTAEPHKGLPVAGYQPQSGAKVATVNMAKELEERCLRHLDAMAADTEAQHDQRMIAIARTGIQEAFMWANRAVFQPARVPLPEDKSIEV